MKNKIIRRFMGYTVLNTKSGKFVDYDGVESDKDYEFWPTTAGAQETLDDIDYTIGNFGNKNAQKLADKRKDLKIVKLTIVIEVTK